MAQHENSRCAYTRRRCKRTGTGTPLPQRYRRRHRDGYIGAAAMPFGALRSDFVCSDASSFVSCQARRATSKSRPGSARDGPAGAGGGHIAGARGVPSRRGGAPLQWSPPTRSWPSTRPAGPAPPPPHTPAKVTSPLPRGGCIDPQRARPFRPGRF